MKILILGGTIFLGRYLTEAALALGHNVTLFNRGKHHADLFPEAEKLRGDRDGDLSILRGRNWDIVIDTSGYVPRVVRTSAELLAQQVEQYTFISSISVYSDLRQPGTTEASPVGTLDDPTVEQITGETYGALKALCEQAVEQAMPGRVLNIRPGLIVGPHDYSDRFTFWVRRIARGGDVLAPGEPRAPVQFIDVRDLALWTIRMATERKTGVYNATGPATPMTMGQLLEAAREALASDARLVWVDESFLLKAGVQPWTELPLWVPDDGTMGGFQAIDCRKAIADGLTFRPTADTIRDTYHWDTKLAVSDGKAGTVGGTRSGSLDPEREAQLLAAWQAQQHTSE